MRVRVIDIEALGSPDPRNIRVYLRTHGWTQASGGRRDVWALSRDGEVYEVLAPSPEFADFRQQVSLLLYTLSAVEDRSEGDVLADLFSLSFDVQRVHKPHTGPPGTVAIAEATRTFDAARKLLEAAATSIEDALPVLPPKSERSNEVNRLLRNVLTGPVEVGSFAISIWVPVPARVNAEDDPVLLDDPREPFERMVTRRLNAAIAAARVAAERSLDSAGSLDPFLGRESVGLSANLCEALVGLAGRRRGPLEVQFSWALDRPAPGLSASERFSPPSIEILGEAAKTLRRLQRRDEATLRGTVRGLRRRDDGGGGDVTIRGVVIGDRPTAQTVRVAMAGPDYDRAVMAHRSQDEIEVSGSLEQSGGRFVLRDYRSFRTL